MKSLQRSLAASLAMLLCLYPVPARSLPAGGKVVRGATTITQPNPTTLNINQTTNKAIINWKGFNINLNELVKINQPNSSAVILNRVVGADPSSILGQLVANGRVFVVNSNGIYFGPRSMVEASGFFATTLGIKDSDFLAGKYTFTQDPTKSPAYVINKGQIKVTDDGFVFLVAPGVANENLILANLGKVVMASGEKFTVDFMGDGLINFVVEGKVLDRVKGPDGTPMTSAVSNSGTIKADGGQVILSAQASKDIFSSVVNNSGVIEAKSLINRGGVIRLEGSDPVENTGQVGWQANLGKVQNAEGAVVNTGTLDVSAAEAGAAQGQVTLTGQLVGLSGAILARGAENAQGGRVLLSSTDETVVSGTAMIDASGTGNSSAGNVVVWSDNTTLFAGTILARGGNVGGNGGNVEVSGHKNLGFYGLVDLSAPLGVTGTLLLDPQILNIVDSAGSLDSLLGDGGTINFGSSSEGLDSVSVTQINATGAFSNITLNAGQINFNNTANIVMGVQNLSFNTNSATAGGGNGNISNVGGNPFSITVPEDGSINFNLDTLGPVGNVNLTKVTLDNSWQIYIRAVDNVTLGPIKADRLLPPRSDRTDLNRGELIVIAGGSITNSPGVNISVGGDGAYFKGGSITLGDHPGDSMNFQRLWFQSPGAVNIRTNSDISLSVSNISAAISDNLVSGSNSTAGNLTLNATGGGINQNPDNANGLASNVTVSGDANFSGNSINLGNDGTFVNNFGTLTFNSTGPVNINQTTPMTLSGSSTAASLVLSSTGPITSGAGASITSNNARLSASSITLTNPGNFGSLTFNSLGAVVITQTGPIVLSGTSTANSLVLASTGGSITNNPGTSLTVSNNASLAGTSIDLGSQKNPPSDAMSFGSLTFNSTGMVNITQNSAIVLTGTSTANRLFLQTVCGIGCTITSTPGASLNVTDFAQFDAGSDIILTGGTFNFGTLIVSAAQSVVSNGVVSVTEGSDMVLGGFIAGFPSVLLRSTGSITNLPGTMIVTNEALFEGASINLNLSNVDGLPSGRVSFNSTGPVSISQGAPIVLSGTNTANTLVLTSTGQSPSPGSITNDSTATLSVTNNATFNAASINLGNQSSDNMKFGKLTFSSGGTVNISQDSPMVLSGTNTAGNLFLASPGSITNDPNTALNVNGNANFNATTINLANNAGDVLNVTGTALFTASAITIAGAGNVNFGSVTYNSSGAVSMIEDSATNVSGINTANSLSLISAGAITDSPGTSQIIGANATFNAGTNAITLSDNPSDVLNVAGIASFTGSAISVASAGQVHFGTLNINTSGVINITQPDPIILSGNINASSIILTSTQGSITNDPNMHLTVTGDATLTATSITLANNSGDVINIGGTAFFRATNGAITVGALGTVNFGSLNFNSPGIVSITVDSATNVTGANTANTLLLSSAGAITDSPGTSQTVSGNATFTAANNPITLADNGGDTLSVGGTASFTGSAITVASAGNVNFGSLSYNSTGAVSITEDSATNVTGVNMANSLILTSGGALTDASGTSQTVTNNASFTSLSSITFADNSGDVLNIGGTASFTATGGAITIAAPGTVNLGSMTFNGAGQVNITEDSDTFLTGANTANNLILASAGSITDDPNMTLTVTGNASFSGDSMKLGSVVKIGTLTFVFSGPVDVSFASNMLIVGSNAAASVTLAAPFINADPSVVFHIGNNQIITFTPNGVTDIGAELIALANQQNINLTNNGAPTNAPFTTFPCTEGVPNGSCRLLVSISGESLVLEEPDRIQLEEELKKRLQITHGITDMTLALSAITLNSRSLAKTVTLFENGLPETLKLLIKGSNPEKPQRIEILQVSQS